MNTPDDKSDQALTKDDFNLFMELSKKARVEDMKEIKDFFQQIVVYKIEEMKRQQEIVTKNLEKRIADLEAIIVNKTVKVPEPVIPEEACISVAAHDAKKEIIDKARKTIGLHSINSKDLDRIRRTQGITDEEELKLASAKEFFKCEMRMKDDDIDALNISTVFYAAKNSEWNNLYVRFSDQASLSLCYRFAKNLKPGRRIFQYIPKMFYERYKALNGIAYDLRHSSQNYRTRIRFGIDDLLLWKCLPGENSWTVTSHTNLPSTAESALRSPITCSNQSSEKSAVTRSSVLSSSQSRKSVSSIESLKSYRQSAK